MRFFPGPQGPCVRKICFWCGAASAPGFAQPTLLVQIAFPLQGGRWHGEVVTDEGGFLKRTPAGFRWTVGADISRPTVGAGPAKYSWAWKKTPPLPRRLNSFIM